MYFVYPFCRFFLVVRFFWTCRTSRPLDGLHAVANQVDNTPSLTAENARHGLVVPPRKRPPRLVTPSKTEIETRLITSIANNQMRRAALACCPYDLLVDLWPRTMIGWKLEARINVPLQVFSVPKHRITQLNTNNLSNLSTNNRSFVCRL